MDFIIKTILNEVIMNHAKNLAGLALATLIVTGCAGYGSSSAKAPATQADYDIALSDAKIALKKAASAHYVWRDSGKILEKSMKAAKAGDFDTATKLALKAKRQGEMAVVQAEQQKNAGPVM